MSSSNSTPSKSLTKNPIDLLATGLLQEFTSLKEMKVQLAEIENNQKNLLENIVQLNENFTQNEDIQEVQLMVRKRKKFNFLIISKIFQMRKLKLYFMKLKRIKSDMLYIKSTTHQLLQKSIEMQEIKVNEKAEKIKKIDYEMSLVGRPKNPSNS